MPITWHSPSHKKVQAIFNMAPPKTVRQVRSFLGAMINHYKQLIPEKSHLFAPLTRLTKKNVPFKWTREYQVNFDMLKQSLANLLLLIQISPSLLSFIRMHQNINWVQ
jgi:hypothetical protein